MITTRLSEVAYYVDTRGFFHQLRFLNKDESWNLFCQKVFCPPDLEDIGRLVANNCQGLPLAIVVIAGLLSKVNRKRRDWEEIARNVISVAIDQGDGHFANIFSLSYNHLPHHLKPCFLYLGGFPEDYKISVSRLIKLWVAEGFLKPIESKSLEEVGEEYLRDLVNRSLVYITKKNSNGKFKHCSIHDVLRDLCIQRASYENFLHCLHKEDDFHREPIGNVHRLYIQMWDDSLFQKYRKEHVSHVRAIHFLSNLWCKDHPLSVAFDSKLLRVLGTRSILTSPSPNVIVELLHLRYLEASALCVPPLIFKLENLQTLIVDGNLTLPSEIWKMSNLRHVMSPLVTLPPIPYGERINSGSPLLGRLQTLVRVRDFRFTSDTIEMIPNLKKLKVECTYWPNENWREFGLNNLVNLRQLEKLHIFFTKITFSAAAFTENFAFPSTLIKLSLQSCKLPWKDMTVVGSLPNLQILKLMCFAFVGEEWELIEGEFLKLKFLLMDGLYDLKYWPAENTHFPCLEQLHIRNCWELREIPLEVGDITTLQCIEIYQNNSALKSSVLRIQEEQREQGNDGLQVRDVPL